MSGSICDYLGDYEGAPVFWLFRDDFIGFAEWAELESVFYWAHPAVPRHLWSSKKTYRDFILSDKLEQAYTIVTWINQAVTALGLDISDA